VADAPEQTAPPATGEPLQITFLDVGQGDAIVVRAPDGTTAMIDAGSGEPLRFLQQMNVTELELLVASHPHDDHIGGMSAVLTARPVRFFLDNGRPFSSAVYEQLDATLDRLESVTRLEAIVQKLAIGAGSIEVLPLLETAAADWSVGLVVRFGDFAALFPGDAGRQELTHWLQSGRVPDVELFKAPQHGDTDGFTRSFLAAARPEVVVISAGRGNPFLHPRPEALTAYRSVAHSVFRTDVSGHVTVLGYDDGSYEVVVDGDVVASSAMPAVGPPPADRDVESDAFISAEVVPASAEAPAHDLNAEYVVITNHQPYSLPIGGWRVCDISTRCFRFPDAARIEASGRVVVYTGYGIHDGVSFFMNNDRSVWNDGGDEATVFDVRGNEVLRHVYE